MQFSGRHFVHLVVCALGRRRRRTGRGIDDEVLVQIRARNSWMFSLCIPVW